MMAEDLRARGHAMPDIAAQYYNWCRNFTADVAIERGVSPPVTGVWVRPDWVESELELPGWCWVLYVLVVGLLAAVGAVLGPVVAWWMGWL